MYYIRCTTFNHGSIYFYFTIIRRQICFSYNFKFSKDYRLLYYIIICFFSKARRLPSLMLVYNDQVFNLFWRARELNETGNTQVSHLRTFFFFSSDWILSFVVGPPPSSHYTPVGFGSYYHVVGLKPAPACSRNFK